jgi:excisionase family DNA binding protein
MAASEEQLLSLEDVASRLQVSDQTVRRWIKSGKLAAYKPGLEWRIKPSDLEEFLQARSSPKGVRRSSLELSLFNGLEEERRARYQRSWRDYITLKANQIASQADGKGYAPEWMSEIALLPRDITRVLFDTGVLGNRQTYPTDAEWRGSWEIFDALTELNQSVEQAWRAQMREAERLEQLGEADELRRKREAATKDRNEALKGIRQRRSASA